MPLMRPRRRIKATNWRRNRRVIDWGGREMMMNRAHRLYSKQCRRKATGTMSFLRIKRRRKSKRSRWKQKPKISQMIDRAMRGRKRQRRGLIKYRPAIKVKVAGILHRTKRMHRIMEGNISRIITFPIRTCTWIRWDSLCHRCTPTLMHNFPCSICTHHLNFLCPPHYPIWLLAIYLTLWCSSRCIQWLCQWSSIQTNSKLISMVWRLEICRSILVLWLILIRAISIRGMSIRAISTLRIILISMHLEGRRSLSLLPTLIKLIIIWTPLILPIKLPPNPRDLLRGSRRLRNHKDRKRSHSRLLPNTNNTNLQKIRENSLSKV